jgi:hypothetical protein
MCSGLLVLERREFAVRMMTRPYTLFLGLAVPVYLVATLGSATYARVHIGNVSFMEAGTQVFSFAIAQPISTLVLLVPFLLIGWMSASLVRRHGVDRALLMFVCGSLLLIFCYVDTYISSQQYLQHRAWTAGALSVGFLPLKAVPFILLSLVVRWVVTRPRHEAKP